MTASAISPFVTESFQTQLDDLLYEVCEDLQLSPTSFTKAEERYKAVSSALESYDSPFRQARLIIYPQGSMRLGTTVKPIDGPHDLDFVCELEVSHLQIDPLRLHDALFNFLLNHGTYKDMVSRKNRCVRITYADEFYMDILPACKDRQAGGTCIQVPDRALKGWTPSNPIAYATWFEDCSNIALKQLAEKAFPIPAQRPVDRKKPLQLAVQLIKRWRNLYYDDPDLAPISIVLTTLAAGFYKGEESVSAALSSILTAIVEAISLADRRGERLIVRNPKNPKENLSERWDEDHGAYTAFKQGMRQFLDDWSNLPHTMPAVYNALEALFGEPVKRAFANQAQRLQEARKANLLGIRSTGVISSLATAAVPIRPNTFHGKR